MTVQQDVDTYWKDQKGAGRFEGYYEQQSGMTGFFIHRFLCRRMARIFELVSFHKDESVLDVGCGSGNFMMGVVDAGANVVGVDYSHPMLAMAQKRFSHAGVSPMALVSADAGILPFRGDSYDKVLCIGLLDYVREPQRVLSEIQRVLKKDGTAVITIPKRFTPFFMFRGWAGTFLRRCCADLPAIVTSVGKDELLSMLAAAGFTADHIESVYQTMWLVIMHKEKE